MLVLTRKTNESIIINDEIIISMLGIKGNQVRLGFEAPPHVKITREELIGRNIAKERKEANKLRAKQLEK